MAFHPYPQLIPSFFNSNGFGPPLGFTPASPWPWVDRFGFGSAATYSCSPCSDSLSLRLRFFRTLTSHVTSNSPDHNAKGTQSGHEAPPPACRHTVSGSVSLAARRSFHLSLTVLVHYRSRTSIQPWRVVPPDSDGIPRVPPYSGIRIIRWGSVSHTGLSPSPAGRSRPLPLQTPCGRDHAPSGPYNPGPEGPVWALPRSLAATGGISFDFFSWGYLDVSVLPVGFRLPMDSGADDET